MFRYFCSRDSSLINNSRWVDGVHGFIFLHPQVLSPSSVFVTNGSGGSSAAFVAEDNGMGVSGQHLSPYLV